ncbi:MAG: glycosyltransferase, partial [Actinoplanes sp.]
VHAHLFRACVHGRLAAWLAGVPRVVATEYHLDADRRMAAGVRSLYLAGERRGRVTIAVSAAVADRLRAWRIPDERITIIPKAIDGAEFHFDPSLRAAVRTRLHIPAEVPVIGGVGRLEPRKRFDDLIRAVREVPGAVLLLVGDGPARVALERLAAIEGVADRVRFTGSVGHPRAMLSAMDVFASPARETFGLVVLEAMAAGLPALYGGCIPLAGAGAVNGPARRLTARDPESLPRALRAEVLCHAERGGARLPAASVDDRYCADRVASAVADVYTGV